MNIKVDLPPNIKKIEEAFNLDMRGKSPVFTYGDTVFSPSGADLPDHLKAHEQVHINQQTTIEGGAEAWWDKFIADPAFRLEQELEAYATQYAYARKNFSPKHATELLNNLAMDLSSAAYGNVVSYGIAVSKIRNKAKFLSQIYCRKCGVRKGGVHVDPSGKAVPEEDHL